MIWKGKDRFRRKETFEFIEGLLSFWGPYKVGDAGKLGERGNDCGVIRNEFPKVIGKADDPL